MSTFEDLLKRLDAAEPADWEDEYARAPVELTRDQAVQVVSSERTYAMWFAFRFDAGPPGESLPSPEAAFEAVLFGKMGSPLDAYRVVFASSPVPEAAPGDLRLALLCNATACALKRGVSWFATWLAARAGLAAIALGSPERAWSFLDGLTNEGRRHPNLDKLAIFEPLRRSEVAQRSPWVRSAIARLWPSLDVPVLPCLPFPDLAGHAASLGETLSELSRIDATQVRALVESFVQSMDLAHMDRHANDPLVRELRKRAIEGNLEPPTVERVPSWFADWARVVGRSGDAHLARLVGLVLRGVDCDDKPLVAMLVLPAARAADLEVIAAGLQAPVFQTLVAELTVARGALPIEVADALVATALPRHVRRGEALGVLAQHVDLLQGVDAPIGGVVDHIATRLRTMVTERQRDHEAVRPLLKELTDHISRAAGQLSTVGRRVSAADVERTAARIEVPELTTALLELATEEASGLPALNRLLLALVLSRQLEMAQQMQDWRSPLARLASDAIQSLSEPALFDLRLRLLDEAILATDAAEPNAELYFQRANMRRATSHGDKKSAELALADLSTAIRRARAEGDPGLVAAATAALGKLLASRACVEGDERSKELANAEAALEEVLELNLKPIDGAVVHQARAHLVRLRNPEESLVAFETALALLVPNEPFWCELAAEIVSTLVRVDRVEEAVTRGTDYVDRAPSDELETGLGMLHLALGEAFVESDRLDDARRQLERGLDLLRGRDPHNEALARIHLARLGLTTTDGAMTDENLRFLRDHRAELHPNLRRDLDLLEAWAGGRGGDTVGQRALLTRRLAIENNERVRVGLRLEIAWLDVTEGRPVPDLDGLVLLGLETKLGRHFDAVLTNLLCNHIGSLALSTQERALHWSRQRRPAIIARLQHQLGLTETAQSTLRSALAGHLDSRERLACTHQLMILLGNEHQSELRTLCGELERLLDAVEEVPHARLDLAEMMRRTAGDDLSVLRRARTHVLRALEVGLTSREREFGHRTMGRLTVELLRLSQPLSSAPLAQDASWLLQELALGEPEASQLRFGAAYLLLLLGPITHPDAVGVAGRLLELVTVPPDPQALGPLLRRQRWLQGLVGRKTPVELPAGEANGPFDQLPSWLADHVLGRHRAISPDELAQAAEVLESVVRARPDVADTLLSVIISAQHLLSGGPRGELLRVVYSAIQSVSAVHTETWPRLREALDALSTKDHHPTLANLRSATSRLSFSDRGKNEAPPATDGEPPHFEEEQLAGPQFARDCFERAVALMQRLQLDPDAFDAEPRLLEARALLEKAVAIGQEDSLADLFSFLVSSGNAWNQSPGADVEKALRLYEAAAKLASLPEQEAQLWKVQADALRLRGTADDLRRADGLLEQSGRIRRGSSLAATLFSRAQVALVHPDLDKADRERQAASFAMDAVRAHREFCDQDGVIGFLLHRLAAWQREHPDDSTPARFRKELKSNFPARAVEIEAPIPDATDRELKGLVLMMRHPAARALMDVRVRLVPVAERNLDPFGLKGQLSSSFRQALEECQATNSLVGRPDEVEQVLASMDTSNVDEALPGRLAARLVLLAQLVRVGRRPLTEVERATAEAVDSSGVVEDPIARSILLSAIAREWAPDDHADDPVHDFALAVSLLRQCVELEGGEESALLDTQAFLARALRYSPDGDLHQNLRESRRLYQLCLHFARGNADADYVANLLHNLADLESQMGTGSRLERLRRTERLFAEAVAAVRAPHLKAHYTANLAWEQTQLAVLRDGVEKQRDLEKALATFDRVDLALLDSSFRRNVEGNRQVARAYLARCVGGRVAEIASWREHLAELDERVAPYNVAVAKHNLANALMFGDDVTQEKLVEGLRLSRESVEVRTLEANPRHHWETSLNIGRAILRALEAGRPELLPMPPAQAAAEARMWLRRAAAAARILGPGEELLDAAFALCELASGAPTPLVFNERAEEAWTFVREASAYLLLDPKAREREAWTAVRLAAQLAYSLAQRSRPVPANGLAFVLHGESAHVVERWIVRAQQPARRPLQARLSRPKGVSTTAWDDWQSAVSSREQRFMVDALDRLREAAPSFLSEDHANDVTWRWLAARPGSIGVAVTLAEPVSLCLLMHVDGGGERRTWVLGLELAPPPLPLAALTDVMRSSVPGTSGKTALDTLAQWLRVGVAESIERFLGAPPSAVLWCPGPGLRLIPPSAVWRSVPVATATSFVLPDLTASPSRRRSSLVMLADPGAETSAPRLDLRGLGVSTLEALAQAASRRGPFRLMGSVGKRFGRALLGDRSEVRDTPASARDVLLEAAEHEVLIFVAHGEVESLEEAAVLCLDASGNLDRLDVAQLARSPNAFTGATVLLLACESGRVGDSLIEPGGLAGTLLSAGAACVVAPLWPVRLDTAEQVGRAVLEGLATGDDPWTVLAKLHLNADAGSPTLGRPAPSLSERRADEAFQRLAFVVWVG